MVKTKSAKKPAKNNSQKDLDKKTEEFKPRLTWLPNKTFELEFSVPWPKIKQTYNKLLKKTAEGITIKGFRKGKAPLSLVEKNIDKQKIYEQVIKELLPETYEKAIKHHHLAPIISPKIKIVSLKENNSWQFKATSCERPKIKLNDYQKLVKNSLAKTKIWTPKQGNPKAEPAKKTYDEKLKIVVKALTDNIEVIIPEILIDDETNKMLSRLLDQVNSLGMTINQYLDSKKITNQQLKQNYRKKAEQTLKLEFILQEIIKDRKIKIKEQEITKIIQATPDPKIQEQLKTPLQKNYLASILAKRKVLDYLTSL